MSDDNVQFAEAAAWYMNVLKTVERTLTDLCALTPDQATVIAPSFVARLARAGYMIEPRKTP